MDSPADGRVDKKETEESKEQKQKCNNNKLMVFSFRSAMISQSIAMKTRAAEPGVETGVRVGRS